MNDTLEMNPTPAPGASEDRKVNLFARYLPTIARMLMGLMFFVFGLNGFVSPKMSSAHRRISLYR